MPPYIQTEIPRIMTLTAIISRNQDSRFQVLRGKNLLGTFAMEKPFLSPTTAHLYSTVGTINLCWSSKLLCVMEHLGVRKKRSRGVKYETYLLKTYFCLL